jgi:hypothetical protein
MKVGLVKPALLAVAVLVGVSAPLGAQVLPSSPIVLADGHLTLGGDVAVSFAPSDTGFFNYTDYEESALRLLRLDLTAAVHAGDHVAVLADIRSENAFEDGFHAERPRAYGLYVRIRPWADRAIDIQAGRVPPTFGAFGRRTYATDNFLIGYPLAYQYLTSLRADSLPANADDLLRMRGRGWLSNYSIGNLTPERGVPLVSAFAWDTGVQVHVGTELFDATGAVTAGTLAHPLFNDDNDGKQIAGRVAFHPVAVAGLIVGASAARGPFVSRTAARGAVGDGSTSQFTQQAFGADAEYSRDYYIVRFETIVNDWRLPIVRAPFLDLPLRARSTMVEGRYRILPGLYAAARYDHLGFSEVTGTSRTDTWDAPVTRVEIGGGFSLQRNLLLKLSFQQNRRDGGRVRLLNLPAVQLLFWF